MQNNQILQYMHAHRDEMVRDLAALASIPSIQSEAAENMPFGRECARCLAAAAALFRSYGFEVQEYPTSGYALASYGSGEKCVGLFGHLDVVPVDAADWILTRPFDILEKDGFLIGRGVGDNKAGVIGSLYLLRAIRDLQLPLGQRLVVYMGTNEEAGMGDIRRFVAEQALPDAAIVPDSGFPLSLGERGILRLDLTARSSLQDITALTGGDAYNTVMSQVACRLKKQDGLMKWLGAHAENWLRAEEAADEIQLTAQGCAAHAGCPSNGESALKRLSGLLADCEVLCPNDRAILRQMADILSQTDGSNLGIACDDPLMGPLTAANGIVRLEKGHPMLTLDIRFGPITTPQAVQENLTNAIGGGFTVQTHSASRAFAVEKEHPLAQALLSTYRQASGQADAQPFYMSGGTYAKFLKNAFATGFAVGHDASALGLPAGHGQAHQSDEYVSIEGLIESAAILCAMTLTLCEQI